MRPRPNRSRTAAVTSPPGPLKDARTARSRLTDLIPMGRHRTPAGGRFPVLSRRFEGGWPWCWGPRVYLYCPGDRGDPGWHTIPCWGLVATQDLAIPPALQGFESHRANARETVSVAASHCAMISRPDRVTQLITDADCGTR